MNVKRFTARTSRDALVLVRQALGEDAVVLSTKPSVDGVEVLAMAPEGMKQIVRRKRPVPPSGKLHSGFSMPSGHATISFTAATILQQHLGYKAGIPTYLVASYVAMSRLHDNVHWASDVVMGAATGIIIGRSVTWHGRNFYGQLQPAPGGVAIGIATR